MDQKLGSPSPKKTGAQNIKIWEKFLETLQLNRDLRDKTRHRGTENDIAHCNLCCTCALNLVNFDPQTAKNSTEV